MRCRVRFADLQMFDGVTVDHTPFKGRLARTAASCVFAAGAGQRHSRQTSNRSASLCGIVEHPTPGVTGRRKAEQ